VLFFPGPGSFTGEDVVELHCHGGRVVADAVLAAALALGARAAEAGEFTLRAFLNDKIDLLQAEAIADLVASGSAQAARAAVRSLEGEFSTAVAELQQALTNLRVRIEAWLDFPDEELPFDAAPACTAELDALVANLDALAGRARSGRALRDGLSVAIAGPPNAGKSSLLNRLAGYDAAIVTEIPGTTRDPLREHLSLDGLPVTVVDTAGLRDTDDPVEREGVRRARLEVARADRLLWVADAREPLDATLAAARAAHAGAEGVTVVANKIDLAGIAAHVDDEHGTPIVYLSALTGAGLELLVAHLKEAAGAPSETAGTFSARRRHLDALARARRELTAARPHLKGALELAAEHLRAAQASLSELTGELTSDDLLGEIFATFCIGK
jgi:tRNA modification GTPase